MLGHRNVLRDYLASREKEVVDIMMTLFDEEHIVEIYAENKAREASVRSAVEVYQEIGLSISEVIKRIAAKFQLTDEDAEEKVRECWK